MRWLIISLSFAAERSVKLQPMIDVLVIGGDSMIGKALSRELEINALTVAATSRRKDHRSSNIFLDLAKPAKDWPILPQAKVWIIVAAIARLAECQENPETSRLINVTAVEALVELAAIQGARVIFLSSDQVYDGRQAHRSAKDKPCPHSAYGKQKADAEESVLSISKDNLVIRLSKVLSPNDALFTSWRDALLRGETIAPFTDKTFAPVSVQTVITGIYLAISNKVTGILQFSGPDDITYASAAQRYASLLGATLNNVAPVSAATLGMPIEERPAFTSLDTKRATKILGLEFSPPITLLEEMRAQTK